MLGEEGAQVLRVAFPGTPAAGLEQVAFAALSDQGAAAPRRAHGNDEAEAGRQGQQISAAGMNR